MCLCVCVYVCVCVCVCVVCACVCVCVRVCVCLCEQMRLLARLSLYVYCLFVLFLGAAEGSSKPKKDVQVIRVRGGGSPTSFLTRITCYLTCACLRENKESAVHCCVCYVLFVPHYCNITII